MVKLRKLPTPLPSQHAEQQATATDADPDINTTPAPSSSSALNKEKYDFNSIAVVRVKRLWNALPCSEQGTNLLTNGVVKNTKRMRFQTKVLTLEDED